MKLITYLAAILAVASSDPIYSTQPTEHLANNAEAYQSGLEQQQQGVYGDQSQYSHQDFSQSEAGYSQGHTVAFPIGQASFAGQSTYTGQNAYAGQNGQNAYQQQRPSTEKTARIISFQNEHKGKSYQYSYETENGIKVQERGEAQGKGIRAQGGYSYTGDDGQVYTVTYTADENGFHPQGSHLPTPPPVPEAIQKSIELNAREAVNGAYDDGSYKEENELIRRQQHQIQVQHIPEIQQVRQQNIHEIQQVQQQQHIHEQQVQQQQHIHEQQLQQHIHDIQQVQQVQLIPEIQQVQQVQHSPELQQIHEPQVQHYQHGQELYETPYQTPSSQQEYQQELTATTAGYHYQ